MRRLVLWSLVLIAASAALWLSIPRDAQHPGASPPKASYVAAAAVKANQTTSAPASQPSARPPAPGGRGQTTNVASLPANASGQASAAAKRPWDAGFLASLRNSSKGAPIRFELVAGQWAAGTIEYLESLNGEPRYVSGRLTAPESGRFFFQKQTRPGRAGEFAGVVEFPGSKLAYRIEPTGPAGSSELVKRPLDKVVCLNLPLPDATVTNNVEPAPPLYPDDFPTAPIPDYQSNIVVLESLHGVVPVVYLDFQGGYTPTWGGIAYDRPNLNNTQIRDIWRRTAEDFMPFNINVTTDLKVYQNAPEGSRQRVIITPTTTAAPGSGGVAYIGSWNWTGDTPCWAFIIGGKANAEVCSHETGHTLGLGHMGQDTGSTHVEYYGGSGSGVTGWAPIMGVSYYKNVGIWCKGEYTDANNTEDELAIVTTENNDVAYRADDTGSTLAASRYLELFPNFTASAQGVIEHTRETDAFQFTTSGGAASLQAYPCRSNDWANLAISATLCDATDTIIASNNPQTVLSASISTTLSAGTYTFRVTGAGRNDPVTDGFSAYGSLGYYSITGTVANARLPSRFSLPENTATGTLAGVVTANNPNGDPLVYMIASGNTANTFALDNSGRLTVANNASLNYETLAANVQLPVQFELFVNITNTVNPALTETRRRVVVAITDVNETPAIGSTSLSVIEHTRPGTVIGAVSGSDPDQYTLLTYSILSGNSNGMFSIGSQSGVLNVVGDLNRNAQSVYNLSVVVSDQAVPTPLTATSAVTVTVVANQTVFQPGTISYTVYTNISGNVLSGLTNAASFPLDPAFEKSMTSFQGDTDWSDNYGAVMRGYLIPPATGSYRFWISSDDNSELWLSTSTDPAAITRIASVSGDGNWTYPTQWTKYSSQRSASKSLTAGQGYYIEARMKEGTGGDNLAVAWTVPDVSGTNVIPGMYLAPFYLNYLPHLVSQPYNLHRDAFAGSRLNPITMTDVNSNEAHTFSIVSGNSDGLFAIDATNGTLRVVDDTVLAATPQTSYSLQVRVTDNGSPPRTNTTTVAVNLVATNAITATAPQQEIWTGIGSGVAVSDLTNHTRFPKCPDLLASLTAWDGARDWADNYGSRIRAHLIPTTTGTYTFYIASDDSSQLLFSPTTNPATAAVIASVSGWTSSQEWTKYSSQQSVAKSLIAGQRYYLETLQKEGGGGDRVQVAWTGPGFSSITMIDGSFLAPVDIDYAPTLSGGTFPIYAVSSNGTRVATLAATDSSFETLTYKFVSGNAGGTFVLDPVTGLLAVGDTNALQARAGATFSLVLGAQDSGYRGLYPLKTSLVTVAVPVAPLPTNSPYRYEGELTTVDQVDSPVTWSVQNMTPYGTGWSSNAQVYGDFVAVGNSITFGLQLYKSGWYWLDVYITKGPQYGIFNWFWDGAAVGSAVDGYASSVRTNPRIRLGAYNLSAGLHRLKLKCAGKNPAASGYKFGLDYVEFVAYNAPSVVTQPQSLVVNAGSEVALTVLASGDTPLSYQWRKEGVSISGANSSVLSLPGVTRGQSASYNVSVANLAGSMLSSNATLRVRVPQRLSAPQTLPGGGFQFLFGDQDGGALSASNAAYFVVQACTNLQILDWASVSGSLAFTNGMFLWIDNDAASYNRRFYRVLEQ